MRVAEALTYLQNQKERGMRDTASTAKQGLPITSSHIESTIKQINCKRLKGTEKFWSSMGY